MANELQYYADPTTDSGLIITAKVYDNTGTLVVSTPTLTEVGVLAIYMGDMPPLAAGIYVVRFFQEDILVGQGIIEWDGTQEVNLKGLETDLNIINQGVKKASILIPHNTDL